MAVDISKSLTLNAFTSSEMTKLAKTTRKQWPEMSNPNQTKPELRQESLSLMNSPS